jgi:ABC-type lipoprotein export system ATPase subunit
MVTHDPEAATFADKVVHLDKGKLGRIDDNRAAGTAQRRG